MPNIELRDRYTAVVRAVSESLLARGIARLGLISTILTGGTPPVIGALDAYLASKQSGLVRFINPLTTQIANAQSEDQPVAGVSAEAPADAEVNQPLAESSKLKPEFPVPWDEKDPSKGSVVRIVNGAGIINIDPEKEYEVNQYNPQNFDTLRDLEGNPLKEWVKGKDLVKPMLKRYEVPEFVIDVVDSEEEIKSRSMFPVGLPGTPLGRIPYARRDWIARPPDYPNALVMRIWINRDQQLDDYMHESFEMSIGTLLIDRVMQFRDTPPGTYMSSKERGGPEYSRYDERLVQTRLFTHPRTERI